MAAKIGQSLLRALGDCDLAAECMPVIERWMSAGARPFELVVVERAGAAEVCVGLDLRAMPHRAPVGEGVGDWEHPWGWPDWLSVRQTPRTLVQNVATGALAASSSWRRRAKPEEFRGLFRSGFCTPDPAEGVRGRLGVVLDQCPSRGIHRKSYYIARRAPAEMWEGAPGPDWGALGLRATMCSRAERVGESGQRVDERYYRCARAVSWARFTAGLAPHFARLPDEPPVEIRLREGALGLSTKWRANRFEELALFVGARALPGDRELARRCAAMLTEAGGEVYARALSVAERLGVPDGFVHAGLALAVGADGQSATAISLNLPREKP